MTRLRTVSFLLLAVAALAVGGCAKSSGTEPGSTAAARSPIMLDRTGGNVPVNDHVVLQPDGSWTATDKSGATKTGKLTAEQTAGVYQIAESPAFASEAAKSPEPARCMDAPTVTISYADRKVTFLDCGTPDTPAQAAALLHAIQQRILA
jgi:hypothetical protein